MLHRTNQVTRRRFIPKGKVRQVIEGNTGRNTDRLRAGGRESRLTCFRLQQDFMEAGGARLKGDALQEASKAEAEALKHETDGL